MRAGEIQVNSFALKDVHASLFSVKRLNILISLIYLSPALPRLENPFCFYIQRASFEDMDRAGR
jgi:hypothetical protein